MYSFVQFQQQNGLDYVQLSVLRAIEGRRGQLQPAWFMYVVCMHTAALCTAIAVCAAIKCTCTNLCFVF